MLDECKYCMIRGSSKKIREIGDHHRESCPRNEKVWIEYLHSGSGKWLGHDRVSCLKSAIEARKQLWQAILQADAEHVLKLFKSLRRLHERDGDNLGLMCSLMNDVLTQRPGHAGELYVVFKPVLDEATKFGNAIGSSLSCLEAVCKSGEAGLRRIEHCDAVVQLFLAKHGKAANSRGETLAEMVLQKWFCRIAYYHLNKLKACDLDLRGGYFPSGLADKSLPNSAMHLLVLARRCGSLWEINSGDALCLLAKSLSQSDHHATAEEEAKHVLKEKFIRSLLVLARCREGRRIPFFVKRFFPTWHSFYGISLPHC